MEASGFGGQGAGDAGGEASGGEQQGGYGGADLVGGYDDGQGYGYDDPGFGAGYDAAPAFDPGASVQALNGVIAQAVQQQVAPLQAQMAEQQMARGAEQLVAQHPELGEPAAAERLIGTAHEVAQAIGAPHLAQSPQFWQLVHAAMGQADATQQQERREQQPRFTEEGATGVRLPF